MKACWINMLSRNGLNCLFAMLATCLSWKCGIFKEWGCLSLFCRIWHCLGLCSFTLAWRTPFLGGNWGKKLQKLKLHEKERFWTIRGFGFSMRTWIYCRNYFCITVMLLGEKFSFWENREFDRGKEGSFFTCFQVWFCLVLKFFFLEPVCRHWIEV